MGTFILTIVIFALAFLGLAIGVLRGGHCMGCSCKAADRVMKERAPTCGEKRMVQLAAGSHADDSKRSPEE